ncbi:unnamed protein product [Peniophora sp. CBMAI 1063]|nr:unnamed protein product [Peniophora sp. CBMAI 1063]
MDNDSGRRLTSLTKFAKMLECASKHHALLEDLYADPAPSRAPPSVPVPATTLAATNSQLSSLQNAPVSQWTTASPSLLALVLTFAFALG